MALEHASHQQNCEDYTFIVLSPSLPRPNGRRVVVAELDAGLWWFPGAPPCRSMETIMGRSGDEPFQSSAIPLVESLFPESPGRRPLASAAHQVQLATRTGGRPARRRNCQETSLTREGRDGQNISWTRLHGKDDETKRREASCLYPSLGTLASTWLAMWRSTTLKNAPKM